MSGSNPLLGLLTRPKKAAPANPLVMQTAPAATQPVAEAFPRGSWTPSERDRRFNPETGKMDGEMKGLGYFGPLKRPDGGGDMTELGIGITIGGKQYEVPSLVPTLTAEEVQVILAHQDGQKLPETVYRKAADWARQRIAQGKSPWASPDEEGKFEPGQFKGF